jgi:hypothetical protein
MFFKIELVSKGKYHYEFHNFSSIGLKIAKPQTCTPLHQGFFENTKK